MQLVASVVTMAFFAIALAACGGSPVAPAIPECELNHTGDLDMVNLSDNLGTINALLARRLEVALVLANDPRNPIGIIDDAPMWIRSIGHHEVIR